MQKFSFEFNFFESHQILESVQTYLRIQNALTEYPFFGMIGMSKNGFYEVFDPNQYELNKQYVLDLDQHKKDYYISVKLNQQNAINSMLFFSSAREACVRELIETSPNFEFVVLLFSKDELNLEKVEKRHKDRFTFRSKLSRKRWIESNDFLELNFNVLHNFCSAVLSSSSR